MLFIFSTPELIRNLWQLKTAVVLHWCLKRVVPFKATSDFLVKITPSLANVAIIFWHVGKRHAKALFGREVRLRGHFQSHSRPLGTKSFFVALGEMSRWHTDAAPKRSLEEKVLARLSDYLSI
jgi:hypothetical protein